MKQILVEGIRCFHDLQLCPLKPITFLVGENSSGKTTFLALTRLAWDIARGDFDNDIFNEEPFLLGSYDQIASFRGGKAGRVKSFSIGLVIPINIEKEFKSEKLFSNEVKISATFSPKGSESRIDEWRLECGSFKFIVKQSTDEEYFEGTITTPAGTQSISDKVFIRGWFDGYLVLREIKYLLSKESNKGVSTKKRQSILSEIEMDDLRSISIQLMRSIGQRPYAFAPIRTRPQRTYDPLKEVPKPEGTHMPMVLARIFSEDSKVSKELRETLNSFGKTSGLFNSIEVKRKGYKESDPFQIGVKTIGQAFNLVDVGYGVSQALPIVVDVLQKGKPKTFLLQQPEVHLHPKAQAELGSFLATLSKVQGKQFIIETHSDYLIDRLRMDIRDKKYNLSPDDIVILYFEKSQGGVVIHEVNLDQFGNLINIPSSYRQFFLEEERRMLEN